MGWSLIQIPGRPVIDQGGCSDRQRIHFGIKPFHVFGRDQDIFRQESNSSRRAFNQDGPPRGSGLGVKRNHLILVIFLRRIGQLRRQQPFFQLCDLLFDQNPFGVIPQRLCRRSRSCDDSELQFQIMNLGLQLLGMCVRGLCQRVSLFDLIKLFVAIPIQSIRLLTPGRLEIAQFLLSLGACQLVAIVHHLLWLGRATCGQFPQSGLWVRIGNLHEWQRGAIGERLFLLSALKRRKSDHSLTNLASRHEQ